MVARLEVDGTATADRTEWQQGLTSWCQNKYGRPGMDSSTNSDAHRQRWDNMALTSLLDGHAVRWKIDVALEARAPLKTGKSAGRDGVVAEMLKGVAWHTVWKPMRHSSIDTCKGVLVWAQIGRGSLWY